MSLSCAIQEAIHQWSFFYIFFLVSVCGSHLNGGGNQFCFDMLVIIFNANESPISQQPLSIAIQAVQSSF